MRPNASVATILSSGYSYYQQDNQKYYLHTPNLQLNPLPQETHLMNDRVNQTSLNPNEGNLEATRNNETQQANQQSEAIKKKRPKKNKKFQ
jgi:hypothetical protein